MLQQESMDNFEYFLSKRNPSTLESCAPNFHYLDGMEQQEASTDERIEVNNKWSIDNNEENGENGDNTGNSENANATRN
jgi:hypothetical protein